MDAQQKIAENKNKALELIKGWIQLLPAIQVLHDARALKDVEVIKIFKRVSHCKKDIAVKIEEATSGKFWIEYIQQMMKSKKNPPFNTK